MSTPITPSSAPNRFLYIVVLVIASGWMLLYPVYTNYYKGLAVEQYERFLDFKEGKSMFYNPWQYRILSPLLVEGIYQAMDHTVFKIVEIKGSNLDLPGQATDKNEVTQKLLQLSQDPQFIKYTIVFVGFRMLLHAIIFWLTFMYLSYFVKNRSFIIFSMILITLFMGNAVMDSDLSFNTYVDVILYLWAGIVIVRGYNDWWILLITTIGALNRETSLLIPAIFYFSKLDYSKWPSVFSMLFSTTKRVFITVLLSSVSFAIIFIAIRIYYGYVPPTTWRVPAGLPMLKLNLFSSVSIKTYMEMFGVFGFLPLWCLLIFRKMNVYLRIFFIVIVPVWFVIHFFSVVSYQSRLFLVPSLLIFLPAVMEYIDRSWRMSNPKTANYEEIPKEKVGYLD